MKILNHACRRETNYIEKCIEVKFKDRYLCIKDRYDFGCKSPELAVSISGLNNLKVNEQKTNASSSESAIQIGNEQNNGESENKKKFIFRKINDQNNVERKFQRNTKNVAKNYCKAFLQFLKMIKKTSIHSRLKEIIGETKYNNRLIYIIVQDQEICPLFKQFLEEGAEKWIEDSKLSNKEIHKEGIELYLNLINKKKGDKDKVSLKKL